VPDCGDILVPDRGHDDVTDLPIVVLLCTGNAARSVIAGRLIEERRLPVRIVTAGTHVVEHQPMSMRTRAALSAVGVEARTHRSHQLTSDDVERSSLIVAMSPEHVRYVRRRHPGGAGRTATIVFLAKHLPVGDPPLASRVESLRLEFVPPESQGGVSDPAGKEEPEYIECAMQLASLVDALAPALGSPALP
jgi:protein-tyrosine-phosphatase